MSIHCHYFQSSANDTQEVEAVWIHDITVYTKERDEQVAEDVSERNITVLTVAYNGYMIVTGKCRQPGCVGNHLHSIKHFFALKNTFCALSSFLFFFKSSSCPLLPEVKCSVCCLKLLQRLKEGSDDKGCCSKTYFFFCPQRLDSLEIEFVLIVRPLGVSWGSTTKVIVFSSHSLSATLISLSQ